MAFRTRGFPLFVGAVVVLLSLAGQAFAAKGIDTDPTTPDLPFSIEGNQVMDMTATGLAIGTSALNLSTTGNVTASGAIKATGDVTGANLVVSGAPAINVPGADTVYSLTQLGACAANQALTKTAGGGFSCVQVSDITNVGTATVPTCSGGQYLTFDGTNFNCAGVSSPMPGGCSAGQVAVSNGSGGWYCGTSTPPSGSWCGYYDNTVSGGLGWLCNGYGLISWPPCPPGYTLVSLYIHGSGSLGGMTCVKN